MLLALGSQASSATYVLTTPTALGGRSLTIACTERIELEQMSLCFQKETSLPVLLLVALTVPAGIIVELKPDFGANELKQQLLQRIRPATPNGIGFAAFRSSLGRMEIRKNCLSFCRSG